MTLKADNTIFSSPELEMVMKLLAQRSVPHQVVVPFMHENVQHSITIRNMGINPAVALQTLRNFGYMGVIHSASTLHFWKVEGAPKTVCDAFSAHHKDSIFDIIEQHISAV
jgi:hypothetical protein